MKYRIENESIRIMADTQGGELQSLVNKKNGQEYLWCGDAAYWGRQSPILFPIVGSLNKKQYNYQGNIYPMSQHGFARDMNFELVEHKENELWFELKPDDHSREIYPFEFDLQIGYRLEENNIKVIWRLKNNDKKTMYFSIGGHPAFVCPIKENTKQSDYYLRFNTESDLSYHLLNADGLMERQTHTLELNYGVTSIDEHMFDQDALIFENPSFDRVELLDPDRVPYLAVTSDMPLFGIWSPAGKKAPFVCIEPWCGRCDAEDFEGNLEEREYEYVLQPGQDFEKSYQITLM